MNKIQLSVLSIFIAAALISSVATFGNNMAFAGGDNHHGDKHKKKSNEVAQGIALKIQEHSNHQDVVLVTTNCIM
ncbi:MAG: hypothetical protein P0116_15195 [Candidatus Nitrosocosmicus sp.]|nr:hypothetical protein [Candidatus Nitrosocosmicus sp.]